MDGPVSSLIEVKDIKFFLGKSAILSEVYQQEIHDYHGKYYENNNEYLKNKEKLKKNRRIFRRVIF